MACLLWHKWSGCRCVRCGEIRDKAHRWAGCECTLCHKESHDFANYICTKCGKPDKSALRNMNEETVLTKITDRTILSEIVKNHEDIKVRKAAIVQLAKAGHESIIVDVTKNDYISSVREFAVEKLSDQKILSEIAKTHKYLEVRIAAINQLAEMGCESIIADVAKNDPGPYVRLRALNKLSDQVIIGSIAENDTDSIVRCAAARMLTDQSILERIAENDKNEEDVRYGATERLTNQSVLERIATNGNIAYAITQVALSRITGDARILSVARQSKNQAIKNGAMRRLHGYFCVSCKGENLPENGVPVTCECKYCKAENHYFESTSYTTSLAGHAEKITSYDICKRCKIEANFEDDIRFTDW